jgi:hypothetical protein
MAIQEINIGNIVNDGLGDDLRTAFSKVNANFSDLDAQLRITGLNVGTGEGQVFKAKVTSGTTNADELNLRTIKAGDNITVTNNTDDITISTPLQNVFGSIITSNGSVVASQPNDTLNFQGSNNVTITRSGNTVIFEADLFDTQLNNDLDLNTHSIVGVGNIDITGNIDATNYNGNVWGVDPRVVHEAVFDIDGGSFLDTFTDAIDYLLSLQDNDAGTFLNPSERNLDFGTII